MITEVSSFTEGSDSPDSSIKEFKQNILLGRSKEIDLLRDKFQKVKTDRSFEIVVVHGESGSGKTSSVLAIREDVSQSNGFFCTGKYFQNAGVGQEPYSAIMAAFSDLCDLTIQSDTYNPTRRKAIQEALGSDGQLLVNSVTNISPFLDREPQFGIKQESAFTKFKAACKIFLRTMSSSEEHPVVIFIDDIQWMDKGSSELMKAFLQDSEMKNLMLILAYRDEEVEEIKNIFPNEEGELGMITKIHLGNLQLEDVHAMIQKKLDSTLDEIHELSTLIYRKTQGNPFHVLQFLSKIQKDGLLGRHHGFWVFDSDRIQCEMMVSNSVAALLSHKVQSCDLVTKQMLKVASLLGCNFPSEVLIEVVLEILNSEDRGDDKITVELLKSSLENALDSQFLEETQHGYQFSHDRLQASFQSFMSEEEKEKLHFVIGRKFLSRSTDVAILQAAIHLNRIGEARISGSKEKVELAEFNLKASKYCECRSAFFDAALFLRKGLALLDEESKWSDHFELTFSLVESLARMEFINGNLNACRVANKETLNHAKSISMKAKPFILEIDVLIALNDGVEIITVSRKMLKELGFPIPKRIYTVHLFAKLLRLRRLIASKTDEEILQLPNSNDEKLTTAISIMVRLSSFGFSKQNVNLRIYLAVLATELTIRFGLTTHSCIGIALLGITELSLGNEERGYRLGLLALKLVSRPPCSKEAKCFFISRAAGSLLYINSPYRQLLGMHDRSFDESIEIGDISSAGFSALTIFYIRFFTGDNLKSLERSISEVYRRIGDFGQDVFLLPLKPLYQLVLNMLNLTDDWESLTVLTGTVMNEEEFMSESISENNDFYISTLLLCKMILAYTFGFAKKAQRLSKEVKDCNFVVTEKGFLSLPFCFYSAMISYSRYQSTGKRKHLRTARKYRKVLARHHSNTNPNANPYLAIIAVEELALNSTDPFDIMQACNSSIQLNAGEGFSNLEALANEQASRLIRNTGEPIVDSYRDRSIHVYNQKWGAKAKCRWLEEEEDLVSSNDDEDSLHVWSR
mmetsp:Transcript_29476/g.44621  ORF Transcript_29476/g.44621 Transcript_29476/m.44621 type:complete len:1028 (-) Transcript_29476:222-3305(-)